MGLSRKGKKVSRRTRSELTKSVLWTALLQQFTFKRKVHTFQEATSSLRSLNNLLRPACLARYIKSSAFSRTSETFCSPGAHVEAPIEIVILPTTSNEVARPSKTSVFRAILPSPLQGPNPAASEE